jgi:hypothetical protein
MRGLLRLGIVGAVIVAALLPDLASATTITFGPGSGGDGTTAPTYTLPIRVVDTLIGTLRPERRPFWRVAREQALAAWTTDCVTFELRIGSEAEYGTWDDSVGDVGFAPLVEPNTIVLFRNRSSDSLTMGWYSEPDGGGFAVYAPWKPWWKDYFRNDLAGTIGHEIGHALGFWHGGTGIMAGANRPNAVELGALTSYYCGGSV